MAEVRKKKRRVRRRVSKRVRIALSSVGWTALALGTGLLIVFTLLDSVQLQLLGLVYMAAGLGLVGARQWMTRKPPPERAA
jgi:hypothetical protein